MALCLSKTNLKGRWQQTQLLFVSEQNGQELVPKGHGTRAGGVREIKAKNGVLSTPLHVCTELGTTLTSW